jgi:hypothetical protein
LSPPDLVITVKLSVARALSGASNGGHAAAHKPEQFETPFPSLS